MFLQGTSVSLGRRVKKNEYYDIAFENYDIAKKVYYIL